MRNGAPRIGRPRRDSSMVEYLVVESESGIVSHQKNALSRAAPGATSRSPSQNLPPTAIYCHFGAAKSLGPF